MAEFIRFGGLRQFALQRDFMRMAERDAGLFEAHFDAAAQLAGDVLFAVQDGADLQADHRAVQREGFDAENARAVHDGRRPIGIVAKIARDFFQSGEGAADHFFGWNRDIHERLGPIAAEVRDLPDRGCWGS